ncbi:MAG: hypothetical protein IPG78_17560 [Ignavibacteria bacterium]|nr:hypothetical protein [Ignavibacteria bacterium]
MKKTFLSALLLSFMLLINTAESQVDQNLALRYSGAQNMDEVKSMTIDASNNIYITGKSLSAANGYDIVTIKYNTAGTVVWTAVYNGSANSLDEPTDILYDGTNIYVTGTTTRSIGTGLDYVTLKYNGSTGAILWISIYSGLGVSDDIATKIAFKNGSAYVTGKGFYSSSTNADYVTIKYNGTTGDSVWVKNYNGTGNGNDSATNIRISVDTSIFITGKSFGTSTYDYATLRYSSAGVQNWAKRYNGGSNGNDIGVSLSFNSTTTSPDIYVTGVSDSTGTGTNIVTIKYTFTSVESWKKTYNGNGNGSDSPVEIRYIDDNNIYIAGKSSISGAGTNMALLKYTSTGDTTFVKTYNGTANGNDEATGITIDGSGYVYIAGKLNQTGTGEDYAVIKYTTGGAIEWMATYNYSGTGNDAASRVIVDATTDRNVYVTGASFSGTTGTNYATIKYKQNKVLDLNVFVQGFYNSVSNKTIKDTIRVYMYNSAATVIIDSSKAKLDSLGKARFYFKTALNSTSYRIVVKHRNSLETWGNTTNTFSNLYLTYDFTTAASKAYGSNMIRVDTSPTEYAIYSGDLNDDGAIDATDISTVDNDSFNSISGYVQSDVNGDDFVDATDIGIIDNNAFNAISLIRP